jgi:predicted ATP-grasp superfamily ATP-dependent carboligase
MALAGREADFASTALGTPSRQSVERATDKELLVKLSAAAELRTPPTTKITRGDTAAVGTFGFPAILKPERSQFRYPDGTVSGSSRYISASSVEEALQALPGGEGFVQPYIPGSLISVSGVSWEGELICALHQLSIRIWPVPTGGSSYAETIPPDAELEQKVGRLLQMIGWSGIFQAQFIRDPCGEHHLIDLNSRVYGSLALAVAAGLNLPGIWADLLLGRRPNVGGYRIGKRFRNEDKDIHSLARMLMDGDLRHAFRGLVPRRGTTHAVFSIYDPMPLLTVVETLVKRLRR